jgi:hypothetical protein
MSFVLSISNGGWLYASFDVIIVSSGYWEDRVLSGTSTTDRDSGEGGEVQSGMGVEHMGNDPIVAGRRDTVVRGRWKDEAGSG